jgi:crotonobetainyl-CoA:carnitine CoA-transferase CaiB-like acyl-CoA transferase
MPETQSTGGALAGIKVLDLSRVLAGPWSAQLLGDMGADVVKVERPGVGDDSRAFGPPFLKDRDGRDLPQSPMFLSANRNKRSITLNLACSAGQEIARKLAAKSDVLIENYRAGALARYGLDYAALSQLNPRLIYCSITGFGQNGPYRDRGGYDPIIQAMAGVMSVTGYPDGDPRAGPMKAGPSVIDMIAGFYATIAIQGALYDRDQRTGCGQYLDISLLDAGVALMAQPAAQYFTSGRAPGRIGTQANGGAPGGGYRCADGDIMIAPGNQQLYRAFCRAIGRPDLADDPRFATNSQRLVNRAELVDNLHETLEQMTVAEVYQRLVAAGVPASPVNDMAQVFADPQVRHRGLEISLDHPDAGQVKLVANPISSSGGLVAGYTPPPALGEHTDAVLAERLGLSAKAIDALRADGVI